MVHDGPNQSCGCDGQCNLDRRSFLKWVGAGASLAAMPAIAGPFDEPAIPGGHPIPPQKGLSQTWVRALTERGEPTTYSGWEELRFIGMPVGGIGCGTVYIGGDGRLWCWDIFNDHHQGVVPNQLPDDPALTDPLGGPIREMHGANFVAPPEQSSPWNIDQGFRIRIGRPGESAPDELPLDRTGFRDIDFVAQYPIARVVYRNPDSSLRVELEAFTPFIPLDTERSSFPATILRYRVRNEGEASIEAELSGWLDNPVLRGEGGLTNARRIHETFVAKGLVGVEATAEPLGSGNVSRTSREDERFEDFEDSTWGDWTMEGAAFKGGPFPIRSLADYQQVRGVHGERFVNSHNTRVAPDIKSADNQKGSLTSPEFVISRHYVNLRIGGGNRADKVRVEVLVGGEAIAHATGDQSNTLRWTSMEVAAFEGRRARIRIVDDAQGGWGIILADDIVFSDEPVTKTPVTERPDFGSIVLGIVDDTGQATASWTTATTPNGERTDVPLTGSVGATVKVLPGGEAEVVFVLAWHFPNTRIPGYPDGERRRWYAGRYADARAVAMDVAAQLDELTQYTRLWHDTWYGASLPHWLLERTLTTAGALQTNTCYRFADGRFWAWEGVGCCPGTCTHVWHYAQSVARLFPDLERDLRERTDFGVAFREDDGMVRFRAEYNNRDATDGQAGVILRTYREHQMSANDSFLRRVWPQCKKAIVFLIAQDARDGEPDGIPVGEQHNTLDAEWFGKVPVLASLYLAALRAGEAMAVDVGDAKFAARCRQIYERGRESIKALFDEGCGYFVQEVDPEHLDAIGIGTGCYIDQVMGQWWAFQVGLGRLYDESMIRRALHSIWEYNFCPDMALVREAVDNSKVRGRPYALAGDAGLVMCTWPFGGKRDDWEKHWQYGYFNECMTGFEYQAAGHMIWEGTPDLVQKGLAIVRAIHDRYNGRLRNPFNEIECSDHYARAMASYGAFLALSGFEYHGPRGHIGFAPRLTPENFGAAFTAAEGWGRYTQHRDSLRQTSRIDVLYGTLEIKTLAFEVPRESPVRFCTITSDGRPDFEAKFSQENSRVIVSLGNVLRLEQDESLEVELRVEEAGENAKNQHQESPCEYPTKST